MVLSAMESVVTMKMATAEDEGLPIVFLDIDDVLCLNNPYGGSDALEAVKGRHADPDTVLREIFAAEPKRVLEIVHKEMGASCDMSSAQPGERCSPASKSSASSGPPTLALLLSASTRSGKRRPGCGERTESRKLDPGCTTTTKGSPSWSLTTIIQAHR